MILSAFVIESFHNKKLENVLPRETWKIQIIFMFNMLNHNVKMFFYKVTRLYSSEVLRLQKTRQSEEHSRSKSKGTQLNARCKSGLDHGPESIFLLAVEDIIWITGKYE